MTEDEIAARSARAEEQGVIDGRRAERRCAIVKPVDAGEPPPIPRSVDEFGSTRSEQGPLAGFLAVLGLLLVVAAMRWRHLRRAVFGWSAATYAARLAPPFDLERLSRR